MSEKVQITIKNKVGEKYADLQTKIITPSKETQVVTPDDGYYGLKEVIVNPPEIDGQAILDKVDEISQSLTESYMGGNATRNDILEGKEAYVKGKKVQGAMGKYLGTNKLELQKDEVGSYTLLTANKYVDSDINVEIVEKKTTPYDYFKDILDNDTTEEYKYKIMLVYDGNLVDSVTSNSYNGFYKTNSNQEIVQSKTIDFSAIESIEIWDSVYNRNTKFKYVIFYMNNYNNSYFSFNSNALIYCILNEDILEQKVENVSSKPLFRKTNATYFRNSFYSDTFFLEDDVVIIKDNMYIPNYSKTVILENDQIDINSKIFQSLYCEGAIVNGYQSLLDNTNPNVYNTIIGIDFRSGGHLILNRLTGTMYNFINLKFYNLKANMTIGYSTNVGYNLTYESLIHSMRELINTGSSHTLTIGSYNKIKIQDTYVKLLDITAEMIEEDEYAVQKKPFVICDKEDEGAMTLDEYVALKNWKIA